MKNQIFSIIAALLITLHPISTFAMDSELDHEPDNSTSRLMMNPAAEEVYKTSSLTLQDFRNAVENSPAAERFVITEQLGIPCIYSSQGSDSNNPSENKSENKKFIEDLRITLEREHSSEIAQLLLHNFTDFVFFPPREKLLKIIKEPEKSAMEAAIHAYAIADLQEASANLTIVGQYSNILINMLREIDLYCINSKTKELAKTLKPPIDNIEKDIFDAWGNPMDNAWDNWAYSIAKISRVSDEFVSKLAYQGMKNPNWAAEMAVSAWKARLKYAQKIVSNLDKKADNFTPKDSKKRAIFYESIDYRTAEQQVQAIDQAKNIIENTSIKIKEEVKNAIESYKTKAVEATRNTEIGIKKIPSSIKALPEYVFANICAQNTFAQTAKYWTRASKSLENDKKTSALKYEEAATTSALAAYRYKEADKNQDDYLCCSAYALQKKGNYQSYAAEALSEGNKDLAVAYDKAATISQLASEEFKYASEKIASESEDEVIRWSIFASSLLTKADYEVQAAEALSAGKKSLADMYEEAARMSSLAVEHYKQSAKAYAEGKISEGEKLFHQGTKEQEKADSKSLEAWHSSSILGFCCLQI